MKTSTKWPYGLPILTLSYEGKQSNRARNMIGSPWTTRIRMILKVTLQKKVNSHFLESLQKQPYADVQFKIGVLKNFPIFTGKHPRCNLLSNENTGLQTCSSIIYPKQEFFCEYWEIFKKTYFEEHLERLFLKVSLERFPTSTNNILGSEQDVLSKTKQKIPFYNWGR